MRAISVSDVVEYAPEHAQQALEKYFELQRLPGGDLRVTLHLDLDPLGVGPVAIAHDVLMHVRAKTIDAGGAAAYPVSWVPLPEGAYPSFAGTLRVSRAADPRTSNLELTGAYEVPLGAVGAAFDAIVGRHIATATLRAFAAELAAHVSPDHSSSSRH